jgi:hypothetical protein
VGSALVGAGLLGGTLFMTGFIIFWPGNGTAIVEQAQKLIQKPPYPPHPQGHIEQIPVVTNHQIQECTEVPLFHGLTIGQQKICITKNVPTTNITEHAIGPDKEEIDKWQAAVAAIDKQYNQELSDKIKELEQAERQKLRSEFVDWATILSPVASTVLGLAMFVLGLRQDRRETQTTVRMLPSRGALPDHQDT